MKVTANISFAGAELAMFRGEAAMCLNTSRPPC